MIEGISFFIVLFLSIQYRKALNIIVKVISLLFKKDKLFGLLLFISKSTTGFFGFIYKWLFNKAEIKHPKPAWLKIKF